MKELYPLALSLNEYETVRKDALTLPEIKSGELYEVAFELNPDYLSKNEERACSVFAEVCSIEDRGSLVTIDAQMWNRNPENDLRSNLPFFKNELQIPEDRAELTYLVESRMLHIIGGYILELDPEEEVLVELIAERNKFNQKCEFDGLRLFGHSSAGPMSDCRDINARWRLDGC